VGKRTAPAAGVLKQQVTSPSPYTPRDNKLRALRPTRYLLPVYSKRPTKSRLPEELMTVGSGDSSSCTDFRTLYTTCTYYIRPNQFCIQPTQFYIRPARTLYDIISSIYDLDRLADEEEGRALGGVQPRVRVAHVKVYIRPAQTQYTTSTDYIRPAQTLYTTCTDLRT
jgi:hypothetical protein